MDMKPFSLYTEEKPLKHKVNNNKVSAKYKQQIKQLKSNTVRLRWKRKGEPFNMVGAIKQLYKIQFDFVITGRAAMRIRYDEITDIIEL